MPTCVVANCGRVAGFTCVGSKGPTCAIHKSSCCTPFSAATGVATHEEREQKYRETSYDVASRLILGANVVFLEKHLLNTPHSNSSFAFNLTDGTAIHVVGQRAAMGTRGRRLIIMTVDDDSPNLADGMSNLELRERALELLGANVAALEKAQKGS